MTQRLHRQEIPFFGIQDNGRILTNAPASPLIILCGSFNPLHKGHLALAHTAMKRLNQPIAFELSAINVDKPPLPPETVVQRIAQFAGRYTILASNAPTFVEKTRLYPGAIFVVGYDTAVRILTPQYYDNSSEKCLMRCP